MKTRCAQIRRGEAGVGSGLEGREWVGGEAGVAHKEDSQIRQHWF